jgi:hypothetical protein
MKNTLLFSAIVFMLFSGSCQKEESGAGDPKGMLKVNIGLFISVNEVQSSLKSTLAAEDFKVVIYKAGGQVVLSFDKASDMPAEIELETGSYYVTASSDNNLPAAFANPYYFGTSEVFSITAGSTQTISVNCELANTMVSIVYSENVKSSFTDFSTTVSSSSGSLVFAKEETRAGYFQPLNPLSISATLTWEKADKSLANKTLTGTIPAPQPKKHYEIHVDAAGVAGSAFFQISLNEVPDPVEIIHITENPVIPVPGTVGSGDLLITEIMYDPAALSDAEGEWIELYNNTDQTIDLQHLVIKKNDTELHVINGQIMLAQHGYMVLARSENAVPGSKYLYGTDITLNNTGALLSLCNYGTDGTNGSVICSLDYGSEGFPNATGASLCLDPQKLNLSDAMLGNSWCKSATAFASGDLGTPGSVNDNCD